MITESSIIKSLDDETVYRVLWFSKEDDIIFLFNMDTQGMPIAIQYTDIENRIEKGDVIPEVGDPFAKTIPENEISNSSKAIRERIWAIVGELVLSEPDVYEKHRRAQLINALVGSTGLQIKTIYRHLKRYWLCGKVKNAFLPNYEQCGGKGKERPTTSDSSKRGRPRKYGGGDGVNVDETIKGIFEKAVKKYYHTRSEHTFKAAYEMMIREFFTMREKRADGAVSYELPPSGKLPTIGQFRYWYSKTYGVQEKLSKRKGETGFALKHRAVLGKSDYGVAGPGAKYQIDATVGDVYLVSRFDRANIIGRPVVYFVIDVFSRMVTGMYIGLEGPSWAGAMMAIANAASDKVKYCSEYGIEINESDWPCRNIPEAILGDRGEMESNVADTLINALNVRIENAPPFRGDMKGIVERNFRAININATAFLPGYVRQDAAKRGGKDYRLDAILDLHQFTRVMILNVLYHNNEHYLDSYERDADMIADNIAPIPLKLWEWGIPNRSGRLRFFDEETVKRRLLPTGAATVSAKGIRFKGIYYMSERAIAEQWFETARAKGSFKVDVSYDPRNMSGIFVRAPGENTYDACFLIDWEGKYCNRRLEEIIYLMESEKQTRQRIEPFELKAKLNLNAEIERVVNGAEEMARQTAIPASKAQRTKNIRSNRNSEKEYNRRSEAFTPVEAKAGPEPANTHEPKDDDVSPTMRMIIKDLEERLKDGK